MPFLFNLNRKVKTVTKRLHQKFISLFLLFACLIDYASRNIKHFRSLISIKKYVKLNYNELKLFLIGYFCDTN